MKISKEDKFIGIIALVGIFLLIGCIYLGVSLYQSNKKASELESVNGKLYQEKFKALANEKKIYQDAAKLSQHNADSALNLVVVIEKEKKQNQIYYVKKIKALSAVNTYTERQRYSDSLSGTIH